MQVSFIGNIPHETAKSLDDWDKVYKNFKSKRSVWRENATLFFTSKIDFLKSSGVKRIVDAGCGDGRNLVEFAKAGFEIYGIDISKEALMRCRKLCKGRRKVSLSLQNLEAPDFRKSFFDAVICDFVSAHLRHPAKVISNFSRVMKKGGYLLVEFTSPEDPLFGKGEKISKNEFVNKGFYLRFYDLKSIKKLLKSFRIIAVEQSSYSDPYHGSGYMRKARHRHNSFFVMAQKI